MSYMKLLNIPIGLLINFHEVKLVDGIRRMILPGSNTPLNEPATYQHQPRYRK